MGRRTVDEVDEAEVARGVEFLKWHGSRMMDPKNFVIPGWQAEVMAIDLVHTLGISPAAARSAVKHEFDVVGDWPRRPWWRRILCRG